MKKLITHITALQNPNWEQVFTPYQDDDYVVFREIGMKEKQTLWLHIHDSGYTGVFINEVQYLRTIHTWEHLGALKEALYGEFQD